MVRFTMLGTHEIASGSCAIIAGDGIENYSLFVDGDGHARWHHNAANGELELDGEVRASFLRERTTLWDHERAFDFAPAQHSIPYWCWGVAIRDADETRTFEGNDHSEWGVRPPADRLVLWMRALIEDQEKASIGDDDE